MLSGKTVLIVEDSALIAVDIESVLDEIGATNIVTDGGGESRSLTERHFDLAIVDFHAATALGEVFFAKLENENVPVVFMLTDPESGGPTGFSGRFEIVQKPFAYEDLCAAIARLLAG